MKRVNLSWVLVIIIPAMILVQAPRMSGAFVASDMQAIPPVVSTLLTVITAISGAGLGLLFTAGQTVLFDGWKRGLPTGERKMSNRMKALTAVIVGVLVLECAILAPYIVSRVTGQTMAEVTGPWFVWGWAIATVAAPTLIVAGVMLSNASADPEKPQPTPKEIQPTLDTTLLNSQYRLDAIRYSAGNPQPTWTITEYEPSDPQPCPECGRVCKSIQAQLSHNRSCARKARKDAR